MIPKILIIGSTGKLGSKLLNFCNRNSISVEAITCLSNIKKLNFQKNKFLIKKTFILSNAKSLLKFSNYLKSKIDIIYFLDVGSESLNYLDHFLNYNSNSIIAVANKEMIIAGGSLLQKKIKRRNSCFIPLDSEHYSLFNSNLKDINKIYITASGGPLYFKKNLNFNTVSKKLVLTHPKWKMGINNLIDSSNFINKILEIFELSYIYSIPLSKIDFLISKKAYIHSIIEYNNGTVSLNCFHNDMIIPLSKPLDFFYTFKLPKFTSKMLDNYNYSIEKFNDHRFKLNKYLKKIMLLNHNDQILFMLLNNKAQNLYLSNRLNYNEILDFIFQNMKKNVIKKSIKSNFNGIIKYIRAIKDYYEI